MWNNNLVEIKNIMNHELRYRVLIASFVRPNWASALEE